MPLPYVLGCHHRTFQQEGFDRRQLIPVRKIVDRVRGNIDILDYVFEFDFCLSSQILLLEHTNQFGPCKVKSGRK